LANQEVIVDFPPQMTKSQQLMDQFKSDPSLLDETRSGEVGESEEEEKVSVYDVLVESMQVIVYCLSPFCLSVRYNFSFSGLWFYLPSVIHVCLFGVWRDGRKLQFLSRAQPN
jgi:hypothetical protein